MEKINVKITDRFCKKIFNKIHRDIWDDVELLEKDDTKVIYQYQFPTIEFAQKYTQKLQQSPIEITSNVGVKYSLLTQERIMTVTFMLV